jgi:hypothetical protein
VRVYDWVGTAWTKRGQDIEGERRCDQSGFSISLSDDGNTVAIGAPFNADTASDAGHVRVYDWGGTAWTKRGQDIDGEASNDYSGRSVSLSANGDTVAVGANGNDGTASNAGHVRVYDWDGTKWNKRGQDIDGEAQEDHSGFSVSLSADGNTVAIGARHNDGTVSDAGHVRVYDWDGTHWTKRGQDIEGEVVTILDFLSPSLMTETQWPLEQYLMMALLLMQVMFVYIIITGRWAIMMVMTIICVG